MKVTLDSIFGILLEEYPETEDVLIKYLGQAYCLTCPGKMFDTIGNGAMLHGLSDKQALDMVADLQKVVDSYEEDLSDLLDDDDAGERKSGDDAYDKDRGAAGGSALENAGIGQYDDEVDPQIGGSPLW